ncbi:MAG: ATP-binding protein [Streptosporangiaceae bacterium]
MSAPAHVVGQHGRAVTLPGLPESVRQFRVLARQASVTPYQAEAAALCVSELVTNALVHSRSGKPGGTVTVAIRPAETPGELRISVSDDGGPDRPGPWLSPPCAEAPVVPEHGYGLGIVDAVAADWGRARRLGGWVTWCEIPAVAT